MRHFIKILGISALAAISNVAVAVQSPQSLITEFHLKQGQDYFVVKAILLKQGWTADTPYGDGTNPYGFGEVVCGSGRDAACSARFLRGARKVLVTLKPKKTLLVDGVWDDK